MKLFFQFTILLITHLSFGQIIPKDSIINSIAYFNKHENVTYDVNYSFITFDTNDTIQNINKYNSILYNVKDSTATNYIIDWTYLPSKDGNSMLKKPFKITFETDELGTFKDIINTEEIISELKNDNFPDCLFNEKKLIEKMLGFMPTENSKKKTIEVIINTILKDIFAFHTFFGASYDINSPSWGTIQTENPVNQKMFDATVYVTIDEVNFDKDYYVISSSTKTDKNAVKELLQNDLKIVDKDIDDFSNNTYITQMVHNTGWPIEIQLFNELVIGKISVHKYTYFIINED